MVAPTACRNPGILLRMLPQNPPGPRLTEGAGPRRLSIVAARKGRGWQL